MLAHWPWMDVQATCIGCALAAEGGHLYVHERGYTLRFGHNGLMRGYAIAPFRAACVVAGLPVIDTRMLDPGEALRLAIHSPMVAIARPADPPPWTPFTWAPLWHVGALYRAAGAEVLNLPG